MSNSHAPATPSGNSPALRSPQLVLWKTKGPDAKVDFTGMLTGTDEKRHEVVATIMKNGKTQKPFLSISTVTVEGDEKRFTTVGTANAVNSINGVPVAEGKVRHMIANLELPGEDEQAFGIFIEKGLTPEIFNGLGFEGEMTFRKPKNPTPAEPAAKAPAPAM